MDRQQWAIMRTSYSSLAMVAVGGMWLLVVERWRGQTQLRSRCVALRSAQRSGCAVVVDRGADNERFISPRGVFAVGWVWRS
jgi:hypothetical protein